MPRAPSKVKKSKPAAVVPKATPRPKPTKKPPSMDEAVHGAVESGRVEALALALRDGGSANAVHQGSAALARVAYQSNAAELARVLLGAGADPNGPSFLGRTALHQAAENGTTELLGLLVQAGADVDRVENEGRTALHFVAEHGTVESVALLLDAGADRDRATKDGRTALHIAVEHGRLPHVELLLARGADPSARGARGATALHVAYDWGMDTLVPVLLAAGADRSVKDDRGISFESIFGPRGEDVRPVTARYVASDTPQRVTITARFAMLAPEHSRGLEKMFSAHAWANLAEHGLASGALFAPATSHMEVLDSKPLTKEESGLVERTYVLRVTSLAPEFFHVIAQDLLSSKWAAHSSTRSLISVRGVAVDIRGEHAGEQSGRDALDSETLRQWVIDDAYAPASFEPLPFALEVRTGKETRVLVETASGEPCERARAALGAWLQMQPTWKIRAGEPRVLFMPVMPHSRFDGKAFVPDPNVLEISAVTFAPNRKTRRFPYDLDRPRAHLENVLTRLHTHTPLARVILEVAP